MKRVLVTGGAGFIGSHLVDVLIALEYEVMVVDNFFLGKPSNVHSQAQFYKLDICDESLYNIVSYFRPDIVYNLAVMPLPHSLVQP